MRSKNVDPDFDDDEDYSGEETDDEPAPKVRYKRNNSSNRTDDGDQTCFCARCGLPALLTHHHVYIASSLPDHQGCQCGVVVSSVPPPRRAQQHTLTVSRSPLSLALSSLLSILHPNNTKSSPVPRRRRQRQGAVAVAEAERALARLQSAPQAQSR